MKDLSITGVLLEGPEEHSSRSTSTSQQFVVERNSNDVPPFSTVVNDGMPPVSTETVDDGFVNISANESAYDNITDDTINAMNVIESGIIVDVDESNIVTGENDINFENNETAGGDSDEYEDDDDAKLGEHVTKN